MSNYEATGCGPCMAALGTLKAGGKEDTATRLARQRAAGWTPTPGTTAPVLVQDPATGATRPATTAEFRAALDQGLVPPSGGVIGSASRSSKLPYYLAGGIALAGLGFVLLRRRRR